jgi:hypothetical protein
MLSIESLLKAARHGLHSGSRISNKFGPPVIGLKNLGSRFGRFNASFWFVCVAVMAAFGDMNARNNPLIGQASR